MALMATIMRRSPLAFHLRVPRAVFNTARGLSTQARATTIKTKLKVTQSFQLRQKSTSRPQQPKPSSLQASSPKTQTPPPSRDTVDHVCCLLKSHVANLKPLLSQLDELNIWTIPALRPPNLVEDRPYPPERILLADAQEALECQINAWECTILLLDCGVLEVQCSRRWWKIFPGNLPNSMTPLLEGHEKGAMAAVEKLSEAEGHLTFGKVRRLIGEEVRGLRDGLWAVEKKLWYEMVELQIVRAGGQERKSGWASSCERASRWVKAFWSGTK